MNDSYESILFSESKTQHKKCSLIPEWITLTNSYVFSESKTYCTTKSLIPKQINFMVLFSQTESEQQI